MHLEMVNMKQQMTFGTNNVHRFNRIGGIPALKNSIYELYLAL
jgi:hypothetical protein